jgi:hypothetical protein
VSEPKVTCGNCGRKLEERSDLTPEQREPCPICGSTTRTFAVTASAAVGVAAAGIATAVVENVPAEELPLAAEIRGRYQATLQWFALENGHWLLHVLNDRGEVVEGGIGDDPEEALLEVYERLIPPPSESV